MTRRACAKISLRNQSYRREDLSNMTNLVPCCFNYVWLLEIRHSTLHI